MKRPRPGEAWIQSPDAWLSYCLAFQQAERPGTFGIFMLPDFRPQVSCLGFFFMGVASVQMLIHGQCPPSALLRP